MRARPIAAMLFALVQAGVAARAPAQTYTISGVTVPTFGTVVANEFATTEFNNNGTVTVHSGPGIWLKGTVRRGTITVRCANGVPALAATNCNNVANVARITVNASSSVGRAQLFSYFTASNGTGTVGAGTTSGTTLDFQFSGFTAAGTKTFLLDTRLPISSDVAGGTTGAITSTFSVKAAKNPAVPVAEMTGAATITVRRSLKVSVTSNLHFGSILLNPITGNGTVIINATTGARTTGGSRPPTPAPLPAFSRGVFTVTGEPNTTYSLAYSPTGNLTLTSGANSLAMTISKTDAAGSKTLPATGIKDLGVGGTLTLNSSTTQRGSYSTSLTVTVTYN